jgi:hypothetical protein
MKHFLLIPLLLLSLFSCKQEQRYPYDLTWNPVTTDTNGITLTGDVFYEIYASTSSRHDYELMATTHDTKTTLYLKPNQNYYIGIRTTHNNNASEISWLRIYTLDQVSQPKR